MNRWASTCMAAAIVVSSCKGKEPPPPLEEPGPPPWEFPGEAVDPEDIPENVKVEMSVPAVEGPHAEDAVRGALRPQLEDLAKCYERRLARHCKIKGHMRISLEVGREGPVLGLRVLSDTTRDTRLGDCVCAVVKRASFGEADGRSEITVTYTFEPPEDIECE